MERGPMALFGAIVAVGLGPAMWLGAQFGEATLTPQRPPTVIVQQNEQTTPEGGTGAGDTPQDGAKVVRSEPKANTGPLRGRHKPRPAVTSASPTPSTSTPTSEPPTESTTPPADEPDQPSTPPSDSTTEPATPPADGGTDKPEPPEPPSAEEVAQA
ncbi:hypothetical protein [Couchioplanes azureus]|uniref:hypothetical protein n=1 Tax=Couchioplanes caeruleus TaxID=56438 RepID=UPI00166FC5A4|nr:hypothetical protein [Couchioplanes caeruleus]GGQ77841.1 hypothetical protein GCM10010166_54800 [Couchioplanes caeruleus subsp. azureus]